ncbi:cobalamin-dependent protein [candidate division KSB1 bacterium]|nr:cobalamin-dependent protein [candidate division KSB1 bacterium]
MNQKIDLLLINPGNRLEQFAKLSDLATVAQPLGLAMVAAYVRQHGYSVAIIDAEAEFWTPEQTIEAVEQFDPLLIGVSAYTTKMTAAGRLLTLIRERMPHVKTMLGGHHGSAIARRTLEEEAVDFVVQGEGFFPTVELLRRIKVGKRDLAVPGLAFYEGQQFVDNGRAPLINDLDELPFAAWDLLPMEKYRAHHWQAWDYGMDQSGFAVLYTSLGCPFQCEYCSVNVVYGKHKTRYRSSEHVVRELELLVNQYGVKHVEIIDDTFTLLPKRVEAFCNEIIKRGLGKKLNMWCFARTDRVTTQLMKKMKQAGINWVFMGFESGDDFVLQGVNKYQTVDQIRRAVDDVHHAGIYIGGNYVFGLPNDTHETMQQTLDLAKDLNTEYANFFLLMAYPGTKLQQTARQKGYSLPEKWGQYGFFAPDALPMRNDQLSAEDILAFRDNAFNEYFNSERYLSMIRERFGEPIIDFIRTKILTRKIERTRIARD